jgi:methylenetetrahydrofolate reductase (NADPH)
MSVANSLKNTTKTLFSFELLPPLKGRGIDDIYKAIDPLMEFAPSHINVTFHHKETVYQTQSDGSIVRRTVRKRPGSVAMSAAIKARYHVTMVPHLICAGFTKDDIEDILIDFDFLEMPDLFILRGDPPKGQRIFIPEKNGHEHTQGLLDQIMDMNRGKYLDSSLENAKPTNFSVGVAGYPEKHIEAPNMESDLLHLKAKVDAGAEYIVTQLFFDNSKYFSFVEKCRKMGITCPIVPGIKPITALSDLKLLPQIFNCDIPQALVSEIEKCKTNDEAKQVGIEWTTAQSKELMQFGVPALHFYTIGISDNICKIARAIF